MPTMGPVNPNAGKPFLSPATNMGKFTGYVSNPVGPPPGPQGRTLGNAGGGTQIPGIQDQVIPPPLPYPQSIPQASQPLQQTVGPLLNSLLGGIGDYFSSSPKQQMDDAWKAAGVQDVPDPQNPFGPQDYNDAGWGKPHGRLVSPEQMQFSEADLQAQRNRTPGPMTVPESTGIPAADGGMSKGNVAMQALINAITGDLEKLRAGDPEMKARAQLPSISGADELGTNDPVVGKILQRRNNDRELLDLRTQARDEIYDMGLPMEGGKRGVDVGSLARRQNISTGAIASRDSLMKQGQDADLAAMLGQRNQEMGQWDAAQRQEAGLPSDASPSAAWAINHAKTGAPRPMGASAAQPEGILAMKRAAYLARQAGDQQKAQKQIDRNAVDDMVARKGRMAELGSGNAFLNAQQLAMYNGVMNGDGGGDQDAKLRRHLALQGQPQAFIQHDNNVANLQPQQEDAASYEDRIGQLAMERAKRLGGDPVKHMADIRRELPRGASGPVEPGNATAPVPTSQRPTTPEDEQALEAAWANNSPHGTSSMRPKWLGGPAGRGVRIGSDMLGFTQAAEDAYLQEMRPRQAANPRLTDDFIREEFRRRAASK